MTARTYHRGHPIEWDNQQGWLYSDNLTSIANEDRSCHYCLLPNREGGHDACLGELPGVSNACCGHGRVGEAYVQNTSGGTVRGEEAVGLIKYLRGEL